MAKIKLTKTEQEMADMFFELMEEQFLTNDTSITYVNGYDYLPGYQMPRTYQCGGLDNVNKYLKVDVDGYIRLAEGTGGTPSRYVVEWIADETNKQLTLVNNNLDRFTFTYGGGTGDVSKDYVDRRDSEVLTEAETQISDLEQGVRTNIQRIDTTISEYAELTTQQFTNLWQEVNLKSSVSGSQSGSSTSQINYLTINGTEYKLPTGGAGSVSWGSILGNLTEQTDLNNRLVGIDNQVATKQETLVSGTNIKTINEQSILGQGNFELSNVIPSMQPVSGAKTAQSLNIDGADWNLPQGGSLEQQQADWNQTDTSAVDYIKNKPTLSRVATTGSYNDLTDKPSIPGADKFLTKTGQNIAGGTYQFEYDHFDDYNVRIERLNGDAGSLISPVGIMITTTPDVPGAGEYTLYGRNVITNQTADNQTTLIVPDNGGIQTLATLSDIPSALSKQVILDLTHPINSTYVQYTADDNPNTLFNKDGEYASTWTDITSTLHERFIQFDNGHSVGTLKDAGLPDITGRFSVGPKLQQTTASNVEALAVYNIAGCFSSFKNSSPVITDIDADYTRTGDEGYGNIVNFQASRSSSLYGRYSSSVMPKTYTAKLWKRTA